MVAQAAGPTRRSATATLAAAMVYAGAGQAEAVPVPAISLDLEGAGAIGKKRKHQPKARRSRRSRQRRRRRWTSHLAPTERTAPPRLAALLSRQNERQEGLQVHVSSDWQSLVEHYCTR